MTSLVDAFPFQHPSAPELHVSVPMEERLFCQGALGEFDDFIVSTRTKRTNRERSSRTVPAVLVLGNEDGSAPSSLGVATVSRSQINYLASPRERNNCRDALAHHPRQYTHRSASRTGRDAHRRRPGA